MKLVSIIEKVKTLKSDSEIDQRLASLINNHQLIAVNDLGAGSKRGKESLRIVSDIAKTASIKAKYGRLYQELINEFGFQSAIELGTNFGIGTSYLSKVAKQVITIEGCPNIANIAKETFDVLNLKNISIQVGSFDENLVKTLPFLKAPCLVYIDGNHTYEATVRYFNFFNERAQNGSILIFDDIYWSKGMYKFWNEIEKKGKLSVDLRRVGIVQLNASSRKSAIKKIF